MKVSVLLAISLAVFVSAASAAPLCVRGGTMASYEALGAGGCVIGDKLFSNFVYGSTAHGTGVAVPDTAVFLTPVERHGVNPGPGIVFSSSGWSSSLSIRHHQVVRRFDHQIHRDRYRRHLSSSKAGP